MKFSTFQIMHLLENSVCNDIVHETIEFACLSEHLNYSTVWLAEHHGASYCINGSPSVLASAIAMKTKHLHIGYAVNILPFSHPLKLAEELSMVDQISNGRLIAGFGSGNQKREFEMFGIDFEQKREIARESLEIIIRLWANETVTTQGKHYSLKNAKIAMKPFQNPHPPVYVAIGSKEAALAMAKQRMNIHLAGPPERLEETIQVYRESCPVDFKGNIGYLRNIYLRTDFVDRDRVRNAVKTFGALITGQKLDEKMIDNFHNIFGIYELCSGMIEELKKLEVIGVDEILCNFRWGDLTHKEAVESMKIFAEHILPEFL